MHVNNSKSLLVFGIGLFVVFDVGLYKLVCPKIQFVFRIFKIEFYWGMVCVEIFHELFKFILIFCPYYKNVVNESMTKHWYLLYQKVDLFFFKFCHEYVCIGWCTSCSHCTTFYLGVKFWIKDEVIQYKYKC